MVEGGENSTIVVVVVVVVMVAVEEKKEEIKQNCRGEGITQCNLAADNQ